MSSYLELKLSLLAILLQLFVRRLHQCIPLHLRVCATRRKLLVELVGMYKFRKETLLKNKHVRKYHVNKTFPVRTSTNAQIRFNCILKGLRNSITHCFNTCKRAAGKNPHSFRVGRDLHVETAAQQMDLHLRPEQRQVSLAGPKYM